MCSARARGRVYFLHGIRCGVIKHLLFGNFLGIRSCGNFETTRYENLQIPAASLRYIRYFCSKTAEINFINESNGILTNSVKENRVMLFLNRRFIGNMLGLSFICICECNNSRNDQVLPIPDAT